MPQITMLLVFLLGAFTVADGIKCIYGSDNGWKGWHPKLFQGNEATNFCLNITMPVDVGNSTLFLSDVFDRCKEDGCGTDSKGRTTCCCSYDLCNSSHSFIQLLLFPLLSVFTTRHFAA